MCPTVVSVGDDGFDGRVIVAIVVPIVVVVIIVMIIIAVFVSYKCELSLVHMYSCVLYICVCISYIYTYV